MFSNNSSLILASVLVLAVSAWPAQAQLARTYVSSFGNDANDCNRLTPCRTFQRAHDNTLPLGEITVLDPGGYGAVNITKGISIINDGVGEAGVLVSGGVIGIAISAGVSDNVSLRGLTVKGIGFGSGHGIRFSNGRSLTIENCVVRNMIDGIQLFGSGNFSVTNTLVTDSSNAGITFQPSGLVTVTATLNRVELYNKAPSNMIITGGGATGTIKVTVADSVAAFGGPGSLGFAAQSAAGQATVHLTVVRSVAYRNGVGIHANGSPTTVRVGQSVVTGNTARSWGADNGATLSSYGDNNIDGNADGDPAPPTIAQK